MSNDITNILPQDWNPDEYAGEPQEEGGVVPAGWYSFRVERAEAREMKSGNGTKVSLAFVIEAPRYVNKWVFVDLNVGHNKPDVADIAREQYARFCRTIGKRGNNLDELVGCKFDGQVTIRKQEGWDDTNEVKAFEKVGTKVKDAPAAGPAKSFNDADVPF